MSTIATPTPKIDHALCIDAESLGSGAAVHNVRSKLYGYRLACQLIDEGKDVDGKLAAKLSEYEADLRREIVKYRKSR